MRRTLSLVVLLIAVAGLAYVLRARGVDPMLLPNARLGAPPSAVTTPWKTEEEWIAGEVARDIVEMITYARGRRPPAPGDATAHAKVTGAPGASPIRITITGKAAPDASVDLPLAFLWEPHEYVPVARLAASRLALAEAPPASRDAGSFLARLTEPTLHVVESENQRVSALLAARPQDAAVHESAALVLAAFGLREAAGLSHDLRPTLSRMTAHLALAAAWRQGPPTPDGSLAHAALLVLAGRGAEAEAALLALPGAAPAEQAWRNALFLRLTDDTRMLTSPPKTTLLERMAYIRASMRIGIHSEVLQHLAELARDEADYGELARMGMDDQTVLSVQAGNTLLARGLASEESALDQVYRMTHDKGLSSRVAALSDVPERAVTPAGPRVIGWGSWSAYFRRHILHQMTNDEMHTRGMLGLPDAANAHGRKYDAVYGAVPQYSFLRDRRESYAHIRPTHFAESVAWTIDHPEQLTAFHFFATEDFAPKALIGRGPAPRAAFFNPPLPRGTIFDLRYRRQALGVRPATAAAAEALRALSPHNKDVLAAVAATLPKDGTVADLEKTLGPRLEYDLNLLGELALTVQENRPQLELVDRRMCGMAPQFCDDLGVFLLEEGRDDEAEAPQRAFFDASPDRVWASAYAPWLVRHYIAKGRMKDAEQVAEEAASTGSGNGMLAMATLLERTDRFREAEQVLTMFRSRYNNDATADPPEQDDDDHLIAFYHRMAHIRGDAAYEERFRALSARTFPKGLEKLDPATLGPASAQEGVAVLKASTTTRRVGLKPGDVIVGVDGYRVRTLRQYQAAHLFRQGPEMELHVWRHPGFQVVKTRTWARWFDTDLRTNLPGEPTTKG